MMLKTQASIASTIVAVALLIYTLLQGHGFQTQSMTRKVNSAVVAPADTSPEAYNQNATRRADPDNDPHPPRIDGFVDWINFDTDKKNAVLTSMTGVWIMLATALETIQADMHHPSFLRYFQPNTIWTVYEILEAYLAVMGYPLWTCPRPGLNVDNIEFHVGDVPGELNVCSFSLEEQGWAYYAQKTNPAATGRRDYISFCPKFFAYYRSYLLERGQVKCEDMDGRDSTPRGKDLSSPGIWSAALVTMHEMFHWKTLTEASSNIFIEDQVITRPDNQKETKCYEPFYSKALIDWDTRKPPTTNVDNYVFMIAEIYYSIKCPGNQSWKDPTDPGPNCIYPPSDVIYGDMKCT